MTPCIPPRTPLTAAPPTAPAADVVASAVHEIAFTPPSRRSIVTPLSSPCGHLRASCSLLAARGRTGGSDRDETCPGTVRRAERPLDRKSTRLNSSHPSISY